MSQDLVDSVNKLTTQTTALLNEYVQVKTTIDPKVAQAAASAQAATTKAGETATSAADATKSAEEAEKSRIVGQGEANRAKTEADRAAQVAGLDTVASAVAIALNERRLTMRTGADMQAMIAQNLEQFAASGFVHWGKHSSAQGTVAINEGMFAFPQESNQLFMGTRRAQAGKSETDEPIVHIAGFITKLSTLNRVVGSQYLNALKFPEAEAGTRVYDSETGQSIDYRYEKGEYTDVAPDLETAVNRAFNECNTRTPEVWSQVSKYSVDTQTIAFLDGIAGVNWLNKISQGKSTVITVLESDADIRLEFRDDGGQTGAAPLITEVTLKANVPQTVKFTYDFITKGCYIRKPSKSTVANVKVHTYQTLPASQEVVVSPVDLAGFEVFLHRITKDRPYVFKYGAVQSAAPDINGVATEDTTYPDSYHEVFPGDKSCKKGVPLFSKSVIEQDAILNDPDNNLFNLGIDDQGEPIIVQLGVRQKTYRGNGNGDWDNVTAISKSGKAGDTLRFGGSTAADATTISPQGIKDSVENARKNGRYHDGQWLLTQGNPLAYQGLFTATVPWGPYNKPMEDVAYNGMCFFMPICTVSRLNQGAYHPSLNPAGTKTFQKAVDDANHEFPWHSSLAVKPHNALECFTKASKPSTNGKIGGVSGRPDERFADGINSDGLGGVDDLRLSAHGVQAEDYSRVKSELIAGTYRGAEKLAFSRVFSYPAKSPYLTSRGMQLPVNHGVQVGDKLHWLGDTGQYIKTLTVTAVGEDYVHWDDNVYTYDRVTGVTYTAVHERELNLTISGEYLAIDIIADNPVNISACASLKDGWVGRWIPQTYPGYSNGTGANATSVGFSLSRKNLNSVREAIQTKDGGASWDALTFKWVGVGGIGNARGVVSHAGEGTYCIDYDNNYVAITAEAGTNGVTLIYYTAYSRQLEGCNNAPVQDGDAGVGSVWAGNPSIPRYGALFLEGLIDKVGTNGDKYPSRFTHTLTGHCFADDGELHASPVYFPRHATLNLAAAISSPAAKAVDTRTAINGQAFLDFHVVELHLDDVKGDFGDNGKISIGYEDSMITDLNGNAVMRRNRRLVKTIGWIKNNN